MLGLELQLPATNAINGDCAPSLPSLFWTRPNVICVHFLTLGTIEFKKLDGATLEQVPRRRCYASDFMQTEISQASEVPQCMFVRVAEAL
eukprot:977472-Pelagomonas_calceolata.AAC.10